MALVYWDMRTHHNDPTNAAKKRVLCAIAAKVTRTVCASAVDGAGAHNKCALKIEKKYHNYNVTFGNENEGNAGAIELLT